jgi:hypothetical protein
MSKKFYPLLTGLTRWAQIRPPQADVGSGDTLGFGSIA